MIPAPYSPPLLAWAGSLGVALLTLSGSPAQGQTCPQQVTATLQAQFAQAPWQGSHIGMVVETLAPRPRPLYARAGDRFFIPASNAKVLVTAAALARLGPEFRGQTVLYTAPDDAGGHTLRLVGQGDPSLTSTDLTTLAQGAMGMGPVSTLVIEDSYFPGSNVNSTWEVGDLPWAYAPPVTALMVDQNAVPLRLAPAAVGDPLVLGPLPFFTASPWAVLNHTQTVTSPEAAQPLRITRLDPERRLHLTGALAVGAAPTDYRLAVPEPAVYAGQQLRTALAQVGVPVGRVQVQTEPSAVQGQRLAVLSSPPLVDLITVANQDSNNLYAEALLRLVGVESATARPSSALAAGTAAVAEVLGELGVDPQTVRLRDGSGLSRHNLVTPQALVDTLQAMATHRHGTVFRRSLAVAGERGTLAGRWVDSPLAGRVQGKSGALTGQVSLAGYVTSPTADRPDLVFALMVNNTPEHARTIRQGMDRLLLALDQTWSRCNGLP